MEMREETGRALLLIGLVLSAAGLLLLFGDRLPRHLGDLVSRIGRLPGDIVWEGEHSTVYFPIVTCLVVSVLLSLVFWLAGRR